MKTKQFNKSVLATSLSLILSGNLVSLANAAEEEKIEVIEVTGIKGSLIKTIDV